MNLKKVLHSRMRGEAWEDMHYTQIPPKHSGRYNNSGIYTAFFDTEEAAQDCYFELLSCRRSNNPPSDDAMVSHVSWSRVILETLDLE